MRYAAFLRGINVGGNAQIKMEELRAAFGSLGFAGVGTLLNSGNVVFETAERDAPALTRTIEEKLEATFGRRISVILRDADAIRALLEVDPFAGIAVTSETRLYVTFLGGTPGAWRSGALNLPYASPEGNVRVLREADGAVCSAIVLSPQQGTLDLMKLLEDAYGKNVTTRNWNTVLKVARALENGPRGAAS
jgi:uncharacterized protein (DUF1697 family)